MPMATGRVVSSTAFQNLQGEGRGSRNHHKKDRRLPPTAALNRIQAHLALAARGILGGVVQSVRLQAVLQLQIVQDSRFHDQAPLVLAAVLLYRQHKLLHCAALRWLEGKKEVQAGRVAILPLQDHLPEAQVPVLEGA